MDLSGYTTVDEAVEDNVIAEGDLDRVDSILQDSYGIPNIDLEQIAGVVASMIVTGAVDLGFGPFSAERTGAFSGAGTGAFGKGSGAFGGRGSGAFR